MGDKGLVRQIRPKLHAPSHACTMPLCKHDRKLSPSRTGRAVVAMSSPQAFTGMGRMQDGTYAPFLGQLAKLVFLASSMHQLTVSVISSIPFVIGQARPKFSL